MTKINPIDTDKEAAETSSCNTTSTSSTTNSNNKSSDETRASPVDQTTTTKNHQSNLVNENINLFVQLYEQREQRNDNRGDNREEDSFGKFSSAAAADANSARVNEEDEENYDSDSTNQQASSFTNKRLAQKTDVACKDFDLRPKFATLKHRPEFIQQKDALSDARHQAATTPAWFFNIPDTRSPFPDFGTKLPEDEIDVCH